MFERGVGFLEHSVVGVLGCPKVHLERHLPGDGHHRLDLLKQLEVVGVKSEVCHHAVQGVLEQEGQAGFFGRDVDSLCLFEDGLKLLGFQLLLLQRLPKSAGEDEARGGAEALRQRDPQLGEETHEGEVAVIDVAVVRLRF